MHTPQHYRPDQPYKCLTVSPTGPTGWRRAHFVVRLQKCFEPLRTRERDKAMFFFVSPRLVEKITPCAGSKANTAGRLLIVVPGLAVELHSLDSLVKSAPPHSDTHYGLVYTTCSCTNILSAPIKAEADHHVVSATVHRLEVVTLVPRHTYTTSSSHRVNNRLYCVRQLRRRATFPKLSSTWNTQSSLELCGYEMCRSGLRPRRRKQERGGR